MSAVLVAGATGVLGVHTVRQLISGGHDVVALVRDEAAAHSMREQGVRPVLGDLLVPETVNDAVRGTTAVLHIATAIPRDPAAPGAWSTNDKIRVDGTRNLVAAAQQAGVSRYVQQSITRLYADHGDQWIDESEPLSTQVPEHLASAVEMESIVAAADLDVVVLRGGEFYGAGTGTTENLFALASAGELRLDGSGDHFMSPIHPADMAKAVVMAADGTLPPGVFNVVDDEPVRQRDFYAGICALVKAECRVVPDPGGPNPPSRRCSAARLRSFGFSASYPNYRVGLKAVNFIEARP